MTTESANSAISQVLEIGEKSMRKHDKLSVFGGEPAISSSLHARVPAWPVVSSKTGDKLKELYMSGQWSFNGRYEQQFCQEFAAFHTSEHGIFMMNGTVTLECALLALGIKSGDEVIVPAITWVATAMAVVYVGAIPVFVDIEPDTLCLDPQQLQRAITSKTKAIIPVHLYGSMANMDAIMQIANRYDIPVVEDCAHAHCGVWDGKGVGSLGKVGSFSFQQSKNLPSGEGGICITNDCDLKEKLFRLKHIGYNLGVAQGKAQSGPPEGLLCRNYRATEFQALILLDQLKDMKRQTELRERNVQYLTGPLESIDGVNIQKRGLKADPQSYYSLAFSVEPLKFNNAPFVKIIAALNAEGLACYKSYGPVYEHILWSVPKANYRIAKDGCYTCERMCRDSVITICQNWLLGDTELMDAIVAAVAKVSAHSKEL